MSEAARLGPQPWWRPTEAVWKEVAAQVAERLGVQLHKQAFTSDQIERPKPARAEEAASCAWCAGSVR